MLALGKLLDLTLAGREPTEKIQLTADGTRLHWLAEGALEVTPIGARDNGVDLLLSAGIHGNETAPIELLERLIRKVAAAPSSLPPGSSSCSATQKPSAAASATSNRT
ncbi:succinylglutamate desuccinylase [Pseudomonas aeruginosa]|nr:succinylglutamate desuccinylase [Pseudomonas aeruginosa]